MPCCIMVDSLMLNPSTTLRVTVTALRVRVIYFIVDPMSKGNKAVELRLCNVEKFHVFAVHFINAVGVFCRGFGAASKQKADCR